MESKLVYDPEKILLFADSAEIDYRVRALDILGQYLITIYNSGLTTNPDKDNSLKVPISFAILTRCDDISPEVRLQALKILSRTANNILQFLHETKSQTIFQIEDGVDTNELELEVNGEHRFFWYCMKSFDERIRELMSILQRRIEDYNVTVRKSAVIAFEKLLLADGSLATRKNLKCLKPAFDDSDSFVRKLSILSISTVLDANTNNPEIQEFWLQCVLPLVNDPEDRVQSTALTQLEKVFFTNAFTSVGSDENISTALLQMLTIGDFFAYHKYLKKAFAEWKSQGKLVPECVNWLQNYLGTENENCLWFYISLFSKYCSIPAELSKLCIKHFLSSTQTKEYPTFMHYIIKTLLLTLKELTVEELTYIQNISSEALTSFSVPVELIPMYFEIVLKIHVWRKTADDFYEISSSMVEACKTALLAIQAQVLSCQPLPEDDVAKFFRTLSEISMFCAWYITPQKRKWINDLITNDVIKLLTFFSGSNKDPVVLSPSVKVHALLALGKISLNYKALANELLPVYLKETISSHDNMRNNAFIILIDMCKCYPAFTDMCIPIISLCFKDKVYLIRYQAIVQIINLFQYDYLKWKESIFFGFLSMLVDKKETIRELGHYAFSNLLPLSERLMFLEHFTHSIFVFNYFLPANNEKMADSVKKLVHFSIPGESKRKERLTLYCFLLEHMDVKEKVQAIEFVYDVLTNVSESVYPLNKFTECIIRDCFAILTCNEVKLISLPFENVNEALENSINEAEIRIRRTILINPVIKIIGSLIRSIKNPKSDLIRDIILFLKDMLSDFGDDMRDILADDKILLNQLQLEIKRDIEKKHMKIKTKRDLLTGQKVQI